MPILPFLPLDEGYEPAPVELNHEEGILDISHPSACVLVEEFNLVAETLILRCTLKPIPLNDKARKVQLISEGEILEAALLYNKESITFGYERESESSQWQGIALEYTGNGRGIHQGTSFSFYGKTLPEGQMDVKTPLYVKPFKVETQFHQERATTLASGQVLTSPPGVVDAQVLRGYGGYYKEGIDLKEIQQVYYALTSTHTQTRVRLVSSSKLQDQHTPPPHGGRYGTHSVIFSPHLREEEFLNFPGAIAAGYARVSVSTELGTTLFSSFLCEPLPGHPTFVNVYFRP